MKKMFVLVMMAMIILSAGYAMAAVTNSLHNLTTGGPTGGPNSGGTGSVCGFCHIPHGGDTSVVGLPLWARNATGVVGGYTVYGDTDGAPGGTGATLSNTTVEQPGANSLTCLSCHDGTTGLGVLVKNGVTLNPIAMNPGTGFVTGAGALDWSGYNGAMTAANNAYNPVIGGAAGDDLRDDHPVGIAYTNAAPNIAGLDAVANIPGKGLRLYTYAGGRTNSLECGSCHDPHITTWGSFLRISEPTLCQACHTSK